MIVATMLRRESSASNTAETRVVQEGDVVADPVDAHGGEGVGRLGGEEVDGAGAGAGANRSQETGCNFLWSRSPGSIKLGRCRSK